MTESLRLLRAWARCHAATTASIVCVIATGVLVLGGGHALVDIAGIRLATPLPVPLIAAIVLGSGLSLASQPEAALALPDPWRVKITRSLWAAGATGFGVILVAALGGQAAAQGGQAVMPGGQAQAGATASALVRNLLVADGLGLLAVAVGWGVLGWLPPLLLFLSALLFGANDGGQVYAWACVLRAEATDGQLAAAAAICLVAVTVLAARPPTPRLTTQGL